MKVIFDNCLVCDVRNSIFDDKIFFSLIVYQEGKLYRISITQEAAENFKDAVGQLISFDADMSVFDGKAKFKLFQE